MPDSNDWPVIHNLCYCTCGGRRIPAVADQEEGKNYGRLLIVCSCCDRGECPAHPIEDEEKEIVVCPECDGSGIGYGDASCPLPCDRCAGHGTIDLKWESES